MKKTRLLLAAMLLAIVSVFVGMLAACAEKYTVEWNVDEHVTVVAEGYDTLPAEVSDGSEVKFTVTPDEGWEITSVAPTNTVKKQEDGSYTFTVTKDLKITIKAEEILEDLTVTIAENKEFYAGDTISEDDLTVVANYATGRDETVDNYRIDYAEGDALALGDTEFTVIYSGIRKAVALDPVLGRVVISLTENGSISEEGLAAFAGVDYTYDTENFTISWVFAEPFGAAFELPALETVTKAVNDVNFPASGWSGATNNTIPEGTNVSVNITAQYELKIVEFESLEFTTEQVEGVDVPMLIISGKFYAAKEAYLYLYEGNDDVELIGDTVVRQPDTDDFVLKFDLRKLVAANYQGKWMDIKFRTVVSGETLEQDINLQQYSEDFVDLDSTLESKVEENWWRFGFEVYSPSAGIDNLKVVYNVCPEMEVTSVDIETGKLADGATDSAFVVVSGKVLGATTKEEATERIENMNIDLTSFGNDVPSFEKVITVNDDLTCSVKLSLNNAKHNNEYYLHIFSGNDNNLYFAAAEKTLSVGDFTYTLVKYESSEAWKSGLAVIKVRDMREMFVTNSSLELIDGKPCFVVSGYAGNLTAEQLEEYVLDAEGSSGREVLAFTATVTDKNFRLVADLSAYASDDKLNEYFIHFGNAAQPGNLDAAVAVMEEGKGVLLFNGYRFSLTERYGCRNIKVEKDSVLANVTSTYLVAENDKPYIVIEGTCSETSKAQLEQILLDGEGETTASDGRITLTVVVTDNGDGTYVLKADISVLPKLDRYYLHIGLEENPANYADSASHVNSEKNTVTVGGKTYLLNTIWGSTVIEISEAA